MTVWNDNRPLLVDATGPVEFRTDKPFTRLSVSQAGTLKSWDGTTWDVGVAFTESQTINPPGRYQLTLDVAGNAAIQAWY